MSAALLPGLFAERVTSPFGEVQVYVHDQTRGSHMRWKLGHKPMGGDIALEYPLTDSNVSFVNWYFTQQRKRHPELYLTCECHKAHRA